MAETTVESALRRPGRADLGNDLDRLLMEERSRTLPILKQLRNKNTDPLPLACGPL
jgi:hypothetical protein